MKYDVIIVGGGITGLSIAYRFIDSYKKILLIECTNKLGGKVKSIKDNTNDLIYEAGAARISENHTKTLNLIEELGFNDQLIKLPKDIDYIIDNEKKEVNLFVLINSVLNNYYKIKNDEKTKNKIKIEDINFFQLCIDTIGYNKALLLKNMFGYDAEFMKMNAAATLQLFKKDFSIDSDYFILKNGLSQLITKMEKLINREKYITIKKKEKLLEVYNNNSILTDNNIYNYDNLILAIPHKELLQINIFEELDLLDAVESVPLLRIYAKYPTNNGEVWFKNIKRTITDNYIRHIIPIDYEKGLIMISYIDSEYAEMWNDSIISNNKSVIERLHKEIKTLFKIEPPEPEYIKYYYWNSGLHVWKPGYSPTKLYEEILKPFEDELIFVCGDSFSLQQGWIEGGLETSYDVLEKLEIKDISFNRNIKKEENNDINISNVKNVNDLYNIYDVIKKKTWIVIELDKKYIYDLTNFIDTYQQTEWDIDKLINSNKYYIKDGKDKKYPIKPIDLFKKLYKSKDTLNRYFKEENEYVKKVGILI
tara:strand:+ start:1453 stop:3057 length:1605 start_codon:yes stop_codon:yes gene_type:complete